MAEVLVFQSHDPGTVTGPVVTRVGERSRAGVAVSSYY
jgi:hypothetical protein